MFQSENRQLQAFLREVGDLVTSYNPGGSRLGFAQNAAEVVSPFVIEPAELIQVIISLVVDNRFCCFIVETAYVDQGQGDKNDREKNEGGNDDVSTMTGKTSGEWAQTNSVRMSDCCLQGIKTCKCKRKGYPWVGIRSLDD